MASKTLLLFKRSGQLALAAGLAVSASHRHTQPCHAEAAPEAPSLKESIVGSYEDRVRNFSSPSRVFEFFASVSGPQGTFMTPEDFARAVTPYQRKPGQELGSRNFKYNFQARHRAPSAEQRAAYSSLLQTVLADRRVTAEECSQLIAARQELNIDPEAHLAALAQLGMTNAELEALMDEVQAVPQRKLSFFALVDLDGDGLISWEEFALFQTLLAIPRHKLSLAFGMFDEDRSGIVDYEEFERFMQVLRGSTNAGRADAAPNRPSTKRSSHRPSALTAAGSARKGAYRALFRDADHLTLQQFLSFAQALQEAVLTARFTAWDTDSSGALDGAEFARFLASAVSTDRALQSKLWERADSPAVLALGGSSSSSNSTSSSSSSSISGSSSSSSSSSSSEAAVSITLAEFLAFHEFLHCLDAMEAAMSVLGTEQGLTLPEFLHAARAAVSGHSAVTASGVAVGAAGLSEGVARVLFAVFDADGNGRLDKHEFVTVLRRQQAAEDPQRQLGVLEFLERVKDCVLKEFS